MPACTQPQWLSARTIADLLPHREEIVTSHAGGTTVDYDTIAEEMDFGDGETDESIMGRWFDLCTERWRVMFSGGPIEIHRAIAVDDVDEVVRAIRRGDDMGCHWTWDAASASTTYHGGAFKPIDLMMSGMIEERDVEWGTTLQLHFGHPHEREISAAGWVAITGLLHMDTGMEIDISPEMKLVA